MSCNSRSRILILLFFISLLFSTNSDAKIAIIEPNEISETVIVFAGASNTNEIQWPNGSYFSKLLEIGSPWANSTMINSSEDGWGTRNYFENETAVEEKISEFNPNYVFIVLGGNDVLRLLSPSDFEVQLNWLIDTILINDVEKDIQMIFIANIYWVPLDLTGVLLERYFSYQNIIGNTSLSRNLIELDYFQVTSERSDFFADSIHLNEQGHLAVAQLVNNKAGPIILTSDNSFYENDHDYTFTTSTATNTHETSTPIETTKDDTSIDYRYYFVAIPIYVGLKKRRI